MKFCLVQQKLYPVISVCIDRASDHRMESSNKPGAPTPRVCHQIRRVPRESEELFTVLPDRKITLSEGLKPRAEVRQLLVSHKAILEDLHEASPGGALNSSVQQEFLSRPPMAGVSLKQS
jgi:hypothetical protein